MPNIDALLQESLLSAADAGNPVSLRSPLGDGYYVQLPPDPDGSVPPAEQGLWSWAYGAARPTEVVEIGCAVRSMHRREMRVFDRVSRGPVLVEDPATGAMLTFPLEARLIVRRDTVPAGRATGSHPSWPLPANVDATVQVVFAGEQISMTPAGSSR